MPAIRLTNKLDQKVSTQSGNICRDIKNVYSHSDGTLTGHIHLSLKEPKVKVKCNNKIWSIIK